MFLGLMSVVGCAGAPKVCRSITSRNDEIKFLYHQGDETGIVRCRIQANGALDDCKPMTVQFEEE